MLYFVSRVVLVWAVSAAALVGLRAQDGAPPSHFCDYQGIDPWLHYYRAHRDELAMERGADTTWLYVPLTLQITGTNNGSGQFAMDYALEAICNMNAQFEEAKIRFFLMPGDPVRYLNNSAWHQHNWDNGSDMILTNNLPNRLNCYVVADPAGVCGYSWLDAIVMSRSCSGPNNTTWAHEAGHHFSLPHPFVGWEGMNGINYNLPAPLLTDSGRKVEKVDGSNCYEAGDLFCDTRPDYLNYRWQCNSDKESTVLQTDPNGEKFRSDATLIMGYAFDACASRFTPEQIEAMRFNIQFERSEYLSVAPPSDKPLPPVASVQLHSPIDSQVMQFNNAVFHWHPVPNASLYVIEVSLFPTFAPRFVVRATSDTSITLVNTLPNNRILYWRVKAFSDWSVCGGEGPLQHGVFNTLNLSGVNNLYEETMAVLSPNPVWVGATARLSLVMDRNSEARLSILDASGRMAWIRQVSLFGGENTIEIPTENLAPGFYTVTLDTERGRMLFKLAISGQ